MTTQTTRPVFDRGPWWWRLRCELADWFGAWACRLEPEDRTSVSWAEGEYVYIERARRPKALWERKAHFHMPSVEAPMVGSEPLRCKDCREPMAWCSCVREPQ